eukprot:Rmarinus@m.20924
MATFVAVQNFGCGFPTRNVCISRSTVPPPMRYPLRHITLPPPAVRGRQVMRAAPLRETADEKATSQKTIKSRRRKKFIEDRKKKIMEKIHKIQQDLDTEWALLLHNDDIHTFDFVIGALDDVVLDMGQDDAFSITHEAHNEGQSVISTGDKDLMNFYSTKLQAIGLTTSISKTATDEESQGETDTGTDRVSD